MIDHLVYAARELDAAVVHLEKRLCVRAAPGGKHTGLGTHNALLSLGNGAYLEIIAPDPDEPSPSMPRPFGIDALTAPRLVTWAVKAAGIERRVEAARAAGFDPGPVIAMHRDLPGGNRLDWRLTYRQQLAGNGIVPFLIDWQPAPHPSETAPGGCTLLSLRAEHPDPDAVLATLNALSVDLAVTPGPAIALVATIETPRGRVELR